MKYIKLFESFISKEELVQDANDICLELNDNNIRTECHYNNDLIDFRRFDKPRHQPFRLARITL